MEQGQLGGIDGRARIEGGQIELQQSDRPKGTAPIDYQLRVTAPVCRGNNVINFGIFVIEQSDDVRVYWSGHKNTARQKQSDEGHLSTVSKVAHWSLFLLGWFA